MNIAQSEIHPINSNEASPIVINRKISVWLFLLIALVPFIGAWFTLRKGYSRKAKLLAFAWMCIYLVGNAKNPSGNSNKNTSAAAEQFAFAGVKNMSCNDDGSVPATWDDGRLYINLEANSRALMYMSDKKMTFSGKWSAAGDTLTLEMNGALAPTGEVVAFRNATVKSITSVTRIGKSGSQDELIQTAGFGLKCIVNRA